MTYSSSLKKLVFMITEHTLLYIMLERMSWKSTVVEVNIGVHAGVCSHIHLQVLIYEQACV